MILTLYLITIHFDVQKIALKPQKSVWMTCLIKPKKQFSFLPVGLYATHNSFSTKANQIKRSTLRVMIVCKLYVLWIYRILMATHPSNGHWRMIL